MAALEAADVASINHIRVLESRDRHTVASIATLKRIWEVSNASGFALRKTVFYTGVYVRLEGVFAVFPRLHELIRGTVAWLDLARLERATAERDAVVVKKLDDSDDEIGTV